MALPASVTSLNLSGRYIHNFDLIGEETYMNGVISIGADPAIVNTTQHKVTTIDHLRGADGVEYLDLRQKYPNGTLGTVSYPQLSWKEEKSDDPLFGLVTKKTRRQSVNNITVPYMKKNWDQTCHEHGVVETLIVTDEKSNRTYVKHGTIGIAVINGERRLIWACEVTDTSSGDICDFTIVFDYVGEVNKSRN